MIAGNNLGTLMMDPRGAKVLLAVFAPGEPYYFDIIERDILKPAMVTSMPLINIYTHNH
jgi:hypothetical protein